MDIHKCTIIDKLRKPKIFGMSFFDWFFSLFGAYLIGKYIFKINNIYNWIIFIFCWILFGIFMHWYFGIDTMLGYYLHINKKPDIKICT